MSPTPTKAAPASPPALSEEDRLLQEELDMLVERLCEASVELHPAALLALRTRILSATSSMTAVPKPLKFLLPHMEKLKAVYESWSASHAHRTELADILSVLAVADADDDSRNTLKFRMFGTQNDAGAWGHEYVRHLAAEIGLEYTTRIEQDPPLDTADIKQLALSIAPYFLSHNAEAEAVDLLLEIESIEEIAALVDANTYSRVCLYVISCASYLTAPDDAMCLKTARNIYIKFSKPAEAFRIAILTNDVEAITRDWDSCMELAMCRQFAIMLGRHRLAIPNVEEDDLVACMNNDSLTQHFNALAKELDIVAPKVPEDVFKSHLETTRTGLAGSMDVGKQNIGLALVNAMLNAGFSSDKLIVNSEESSAWMAKNKGITALVTTASVGMITLWDVDMGLSYVDKYLYSEDDHVKAGALLAIGILNTGVRNEADPALALLCEHVTSENPTIRASAIMGLGIAYAGSGNSVVLDLLIGTVSDTGITMELSATAALALGQVFVGSANGEITSSILQAMMERDDASLSAKHARFLALGLALLFVGRKDDSEATLETLKAIEHPIGKQACVLVEMCAYAGTGNVLKIQQMMHLCSDHLDVEKEDATFQTFAVIGIALIAMGEDVGAEMSLRTFNHLMHYGDAVVRKAVPLALGLLCASNPEFSFLDTLSKYSHDNDGHVAVNAIFAMGLVGAGTNNARLAQMLRQLAMYYHKDAQCLLAVRISQGLLHFSKGTVSLNPYYGNRQILLPSALAGLLTCVMSFTEAKEIILGTSPQMLFSLAPAVSPRFLITVDEKLEKIAVQVRVGQAVDVVGQAGRPKTITGFQTHTTPVLLAYNERAELATSEYISLAPDFEGVVILRKNPDYEAEKVV